MQGIWLDKGNLQRRAVPVAIIGLMLAGSVSADELIISDQRDTLDRIVAGPDLLHGIADPQHEFYVADYETYDSNVFRLPNTSDVHALVGPDGSRADYISAPTLGAGAQWLLGRQIVQVTGVVAYNDYAHNSGLSNASTDDKVVWDWALGNLFSGQIGATYQRTLLSFVNSAIFTKDILQRTAFFASGRYQIGPHWDVYSGISQSKIDLSEAAVASNDNSQRAVIVGGDLITSPLDSFGIDYRYTDTRYPNAQTTVSEDGTATFRPGYHEDRVRFIVRRSLSDKTLLDAAGGYMHRDYGTDVIGAFSGPVWRVSVGWAPTDKTQLIGAVYRELQAYFSDQTNYYRATGVSIGPNWIPTEKISFKFLVSREAQNYIGSSASIQGLTPARRDTVNAQQVLITYLPIRALSLEMSVHHETRASNAPFRPYADNTATLGAKFTF